MWILLDENVPVDLLAVLRAAGHEAESAGYLGWKGLKNGEILGRAASRYDLLLTRDGDFDETLLGKQVDSGFGIVLLAIPQQQGPAYAAIFAGLWPSGPEHLIGRATRLGL
jgi:predicted nuclease of predicted toxin-antitoxin system